MSGCSDSKITHGDYIIYVQSAVAPQGHGPGREQGVRTAWSLNLKPNSSGALNILTLSPLCKLFIRVICLPIQLFALLYATTENKTQDELTRLSRITSPWVSTMTLWFHEARKGLFSSLGFQAPSGWAARMAKSASHASTTITGRPSSARAPSSAP